MSTFPNSQKTLLQGHSSQDTQCKRVFPGGKRDNFGNKGNHFSSQRLYFSESRNALGNDKLKRQGIPVIEQGLRTGVNILVAFSSILTIGSLLARSY